MDHLAATTTATVLAWTRPDYGTTDSSLVLDVLAIWWLLFRQDTAPVSGRSHVNLPLASDANAHFYASTHMTPLHRPTARTPPAPHVIHRVFRISHGSHMPC